MDIAQFKFMPMDTCNTYFKYIALAHFDRFMSANVWLNDSNQYEDISPAEYIRRYLTAVESLNNVIEYFYHEHNIPESDDIVSVKDFRGRVQGKWGELKGIADIANAYKHCSRDKQRTSLIAKAKDIFEIPSIYDWRRSEGSTTTRALLCRLVPDEYIEALVNGVNFWKNLIHENKNDQLITFCG
ncbi:hypothetical protein [Laribacter hongkongensis]|uniref:hypothetical protein n=1 Tax=Laribacter hongkongensis TaxID=168471 RepID=UPI001EFE7E46|nr:hypothetical protein [Laribacter hongkongensis]MCG9095940.1 hypothetical protein [Laribacter hongkongensis]